MSKLLLNQIVKVCSLQRIDLGAPSAEAVGQMSLEIKAGAEVIVSASYDRDVVVVERPVFVRYEMGDIVLRFFVARSDLEEVFVDWPGCQPVKKFAD